MNKDIKEILVVFLGWRIILFIFLFLSLSLLPLQKNFLGGGMKNYLAEPFLWAWLNFDGEHYLAVAREGYRPLTHFYFPGFPISIRFLSQAATPRTLALTGVATNTILSLVAFLGLYKLVSLDHNKKLARESALVLATFPASFFLAAFYTEALFLSLVVWSFFFARKKNWALAVILASLATATRVVGVVLLPALAWELFVQNKMSLKKLNYFYLLVIPLGLLIYMNFLHQTTGDPLVFLNTVGIFGDQRSSQFITLPQVYFRYLFRIIPSLSLYWPATFTILLEFAIATLFLILAIIGFLKIRLSYWIYLVGAYLIPTLSGSFSSMPRYALVLFPGMVLIAKYLQDKPNSFKIAYYLASTLLLFVSSILFFRGYWVA